MSPPSIGRRIPRRRRRPRRCRRIRRSCTRRWDGWSFAAAARGEGVSKLHSGGKCGPNTRRIRRSTRARDRGAGGSTRIGAAAAAAAVSAIRGSLASVEMRRRLEGTPRGRRGRRTPRSRMNSKSPSRWISRSGRTPQSQNVGRSSGPDHALPVTGTPLVRPVPMCTSMKKGRDAATKQVCNGAIPVPLAIPRANRRTVRMRRSRGQRCVASVHSL